MSTFTEEQLKGVTLPAGGVLFREGDAASAFYIVKNGKIACVKKSDGRMVVIFVAGDKELVGEDSILSGSKAHDYGALALEECEVIRIDRKEVDSVVSAHSDWIKKILENISGKIKNTAGLIAEHRIEDDRLYGGEALSDETIALIKTKLG